MTTPPNDDADLRDLLGDAVSDVHPEGDTAQIRARAKRPSPGRWVPLTVAAAIATVVVIGGAAWLAQHQPTTPAAGPGSPDAETSQQGSAAQSPGRTVTVPVYYVGDTASGPRLFRETHAVEDVTGSDLDAAVQEALTASPLDPDYRAPVSGGGPTVTTSADGGTLTVDLSEQLARPAGMDEEAATMALQSLVWTADAVAGTEAPVRFTVAGQPADQVFGIDTAEAVQRAGADSVLATVSISSPAQGATVPTQFEVTGQAATFEANVVWELKQGDRVVRNGFTTAQECCTLAPYTFTVTVTPGDYTLVVHDTDESGGEGVGTSQDTKDLTVR